MDSVWVLVLIARPVLVFQHSLAHDAVVHLAALSSLCRFNSKRERTKFKKALQRAEWVGRQEAKNAWAKALEEEEAKKIPYEVRRWGVPSFALEITNESTLEL